MSSWTYNPDDSPLSYRGHTVLNHNNRTSIIFILCAREPNMTPSISKNILRVILFLLFTVALISYFNRIPDSRLALFSGTYGSFPRCVTSCPTSLITPSLPRQSTIQPQGWCRLSLLQVQSTVKNLNLTIRGPMLSTSSVIPALGTGPLSQKSPAYSLIFSCLPPFPAHHCPSPSQLQASSRDCELRARWIFLSSPLLALKFSSNLFSSIVAWPYVNLSVWCH